MPDHRPSRTPSSAKTAWPCRPLLRGTWRDVPARIADAIEAEGTRPGNRPNEMPTPIASMRSMKLSFYPDHFLVEARARYSVEADGIFRMIVGPDDMYILNGTSSPIHELNARVLQLTDDAAGDEYLRFFCGAIRGEAGPFGLVEDMSMLTVNPALEAEALARVKAAVCPLERRKDAGCDVHLATVVHGTALFRSHFKVRPNGLVEMLDDELVVPNVLERASTYDGIWEVIGEPAAASPGRAH